MGQSLLALCPPHWSVLLFPKILNLKMSVKMKDVLNVFRQNKMDKALGLLEHPTKYRSHNPILSASNESYSVLGERKSYQTSNFINAARTEDGTTSYMRQTFHN